MADKDKGIPAIALPGGSYDADELRKKLEHAVSVQDKSTHAERIEKAIEEARSPVVIPETGEEVKPDFSRSQTVPDHHELKEVEDLQGVKRELAVPIPATEDDTPAEEEAARVGVADRTTARTTSDSTSGGDAGKSGK